MVRPAPLSPLVATWVAQVRWGDRRLHAEALDRDGRRKLKLGRSPDADVVLATEANATLEWTELGLRVWLSAGFTGRAELRGEEPIQLSGLLAHGRGREDGDALTLLLEPGESLTLRAGSLQLQIGAAAIPVTRLSIDVKSLGLLALAIFAVGLVFASI